MEFVPFTATTRMSGVNAGDDAAAQGRGRLGRALGAREGRRACPPSSTAIVERVAREGGTPLVVAERRRRRAARVLGVIYLKDIVKGGMRERFDRLRAMGIRTVMITGDNPLTAAAIAQRSGRRRLPRRGEAGGQDGADPARAERRQARRDDGRRHQRRARAGAGRRRRRDEHRHAGGEGSRQHDRPRLQPDEAHRGRRDRKAAADDARLADDVLDRERRREVLRDHSRDVRRDVSARSRRSTSCGCTRRSRRSSRA